jgi:hypothetical protein
VPQNGCNARLFGHLFLGRSRTTHNADALQYPALSMPQKKWCKQEWLIKEKGVF